MLNKCILIASAGLVISLVVAFAMYCKRGAIYEESLHFTYAISGGYVNAAERDVRQRTLRSLSDCFTEWKYESKSRSRPFYKKVAERTIETYGNSAPITLEKINRLLKDVRFVVQEGADADSHVGVRVEFRGDDPQLLKATIEAYKACLSEYVSEENKTREERAMSALIGRRISLKAEVDRLNKGIADQNLSDSEKAVLRDKKANLEDVLLKLEVQIKEAARTAHEYRREISFLPNK